MLMPYNWKKVKQFAPAVIMFYISIACNMRLLARATVDTFIVIRSVAPILTQVGEVFCWARTGRTATPG